MEEDHSIVSYEPSWQSVKEILALPGFQLVLSVWNLVEIGSATDKVQREKRLAFLEEFNPLWVHERVQVQKREVTKFVWKELFGVNEGGVKVFTSHLSEVESYLAGSQTRIGLTARQWIKGIDYARIEELKKPAPNALKILQTLDKKSFKAKQKAIFKKWIEGLVPDAGQDGKLLTRKCKETIVDYCEGHQTEFFAVCKSLYVEDALSTARAAALGRKPQRSDGIDLMHAVIALAYCDYFVVRDGFVAQCATQAVKALCAIDVGKRVQRTDRTVKGIAS